MRAEASPPPGGRAAKDAEGAAEPAGEAAIREAHIVVRKNARYATLGEPGPALREVWFVLHGYRQLARRFLRRFLPLAGPERLFVAPEGLSRFYLDEHGGPHGPEARVGATWMTREDRLTEIADYVRYLDTLHEEVTGGLGGAPVRVRALGFSQGGATASRWAALGEERLDELILWSSGFPPDLPWDRALPRLAGMTLTLAAGAQDPWLTPARVDAELGSLRERGLRPRVVRYAGGHEITEAALREVAGTPSHSPESESP